MKVTYLVKEKRTAKGMTQKELSKYSGVSKSMISAIELEERNPTVITLCQLALALKVTPLDLFKYSS